MAITWYPNLELHMSSLPGDLNIQFYGGYIAYIGFLPGDWSIGDEFHFTYLGNKAIKWYSLLTGKHKNGVNKQPDKKAWSSMIVFVYLFDCLLFSACFEIIKRTLWWKDEEENWLFLFRRQMQ